MQGFSVVTSDDHKAGEIVEDRDDYLIVEFGTLRKQKHVLPKAFAHPYPEKECVTATVTWDILKDSPTLESDGLFDRNAVAEHYGLAEHFEDEAAPTSGYGETLPGDPAYGPDEPAQAAGIKTAEQERVEIRERLAEGVAGEQAPHTSPGITGGDRYRDAPGVKPAND